MSAPAVTGRSWLIATGRIGTTLAALGATYALWQWLGTLRGWWALDLRIVALTVFAVLALSAAEAAGNRLAKRLAPRDG